MAKDFGDPEQIATVRQLLELHDGVTVEFVTCHRSGSTNIMLRIADPWSLGRLAAEAENTNVAFIVWAGDNGPTDDWASTVRFELRAAGDTEGTEWSPLEQLCANMFHDLCRRGLLDPAEKERLFAPWQRGEMGEPPEGKIS
jgi:hypothetical protein